MKTELKNCPFCGGEAELNCTDNNKYFSIFCNVCCAESQVVFSEKEAVELWNRREKEREKK